VVQQQKLVLEALQRRIEKEGYAVDIAEDGETADRMARTGNYDVIVLGLSLPKIDGMTLLKNWRQDGVPTDILVLTAKDSTQEKIQGLNLGADDYLTKPFQMDELIARLRALLRRRPGKTSILRVHDLEIDPGARSAKRGNQPIRLTPREFELLHYLAKHPGKVMSRSMIWEHLYKDQAGASSNVVDVYIAYLRAKVDNGFDLKLILTRRGEGYMMRGLDEK
jgi:DNA-binding response OmpR family regulator